MSTPRRRRWRVGAATVRGRPIFLLAALLYSSDALAGPPTFLNRTAIVGATVVDVSNEGRSSDDIVNSTVLIEGGRITFVGSPRMIKLPPGTRIIDGTSKYLIPGLIDGYGAIRSDLFVDAYLYEGVTTVLVPLAATDSGVAGETAVTDGGVLSVLKAPALSGGSTETSARDVMSFVSAAVRDGARAILIGPAVLPEQVRAVAKHAHRHHLAVLGELASTGYAAAISSNVDAFIRHDKYQLWLSEPAAWAAYANDPRGGGARAAMRSICGNDNRSQAIAEFAGRLRSGRTALMPVLAMEATADDVGSGNPWTAPAAAFFTPSDLDDPVSPTTGARPFLQAHAERAAAIRACAVRKQEIDRELHAKGAAFLTGSSAPGYGVMPGSGVHLEVKLLQGIGFTPREALAAATGNFATYLHWRDRGLVARGRRADLLLLGADPRTDASALDDISAVFVAGHQIDRDRLREKGRRSESRSTLKLKDPFRTAAGGGE